METRPGKIALEASRGLVLLLAALCLSFSAVLPVAGETRAHPLLGDLAAQEPDALVRVIVQQEVTGRGAKGLVEQLGGRVTDDLAIINAFAAELPARGALALAHEPGVRWVSLDAPVRQSDGTVTSTSWMTALGTAVPSTVANAALAADSAFGPNGTFAYGTDNKKLAAGGLQVEATPGNSVTQVQALLVGYVPSALGHDLKVQVYLSGRKIKEYAVKHELLDPHVGPSNVGEIEVDLTAARAWQWADFDDQLELVVDLGPFDGKDFIYLDAIGLRVTSAPGMDTSLAGGITSLPKAAIDTGKLVNVYNRVVRATNVWNEAPDYLQGQGVTVAVVDSGITKHYDIGSRLVAKVNFNDGFHDSVDRYGHGTFVASILAGDGKRSGGQYVGIAPKTNLINVRISDDQGMARESDVINALQWVLQNKERYNIRVVNLSLNSSIAQSYHTSPLDAASEILWFNGIVVVVAAGNNGGGPLFPPANDPFVITVGATDDRGTPDTGDDAVAAFSAYGTTENGATKPELVAPGTNLVAYVPENDKITIGRLHPRNRVSKDFFRGSGTSFAAPQVSGAVALLLQDQPNLNPDQIKYRLMTSANRNWSGYEPSRAGAGYLDVYAAIKTSTSEGTNAGLPISGLLTTGPNGVLGPTVNWGSVNWGSVNWGSVNWGSVNWGSVNWGSVNWGSDYWEP